VTFPEDYQAEDSRVKQAVFAVKVHEVAESTLPELDEDFLRNLGSKKAVWMPFELKFKIIWKKS
jgi:FKBP-type peptidyl-prolyl cis-trans isomerase (trigger factor)